MNYTYYDLGEIRTGVIVEVTLEGNAANVQLLDDENYLNYKGGKQYQYIGGLTKQNVMRLKTTHASHWHLAIDLRGMNGNVVSSVKMISSPASKIKTQK